MLSEDSEELLLVDSLDDFKLRPSSPRCGKFLPHPTTPHFQSANKLSSCSRGQLQPSPYSTTHRRQHSKLNQAADPSPGRTRKKLLAHNTAGNTGSKRSQVMNRKRRGFQGFAGIYSRGKEVLDNRYPTWTPEFKAKLFNSKLHTGI